MVAASIAQAHTFTTARDAHAGHSHGGVVTSVSSVAAADAAPVAAANAGVASAA